MKYIILLSFIFVSYTMINAQITVTGKVIDTDNQVIEFANVVLLKTENKVIVAGTITDEEGNFTVKTDKRGKFSLQISFVGFENYTKGVSNTIDLGNITLKPDTELDEVVITARKKVIERKVDRLVFNVENSIVSQGSDGLEVLQRTPRIDISNNTIKLIGKDNLRLMVNGRFVNLSGNDLHNYLKSLRSDNIKRVEVITTPPAKYDAEGNSGLINIVLKKTVLKGFNGSFSTTFIQRSYPAFIPVANINYGSKKLNISYSISVNKEKKKYLSQNNIIRDDLLWNTKGVKKDKNDGISSNLDINYNINSNSEIGLIYSSSFWKTNQDSDRKSLFIKRVTNSIDSTLITDIQSNIKSNFHSITAYYDVNLDTIGRKVSFSINYLNKNIETDKTFKSLGVNNKSYISSQSAFIISDGLYNVLTFGTDFTLPYSFANIEVGAKLLYIKNNSDLSYFDSLSGILTLNNNISNAFEYVEKTQSVYISAEKEISDKLIIEGGLRFENTSVDGFSPTTKETNEDNYYSIFPTFYLEYIPNEKNTYSFSYSKRIERPKFYDLNPFRTYFDAYSYDTGNPYLVAYFSNSFELSHIYDNNLSTTLYLLKNKNSIDYITLNPVTSNKVISKPENYLNQDEIGIDLSKSFDITKWFNSYNSIVAYYSNSKSDLPQITIPQFSGYGYYLSSKNTFVLNRKKKVYLYVNYLQSFPSTDGLLKIGNRSSLDLGIKFKLLKNKLSMNIAFNDMFKKNINKNTEMYNRFKLYNELYNDIRYFSVSAYYRFGKSKSKRKRKSISRENEIRL